jgi:outer membrane lipoprotein-sorting protein
MMQRATPWVIAAVCAVIGGASWAWRKQETRADNGAPAGSAIVANAWGPGRKVALRGRQLIKFSDPGADGKMVSVAAQVLYSQDGKMRIEYLSPPLEGAKVWESGDRTYRYNPHLKRLSVALRRKSPEDQAREELALLETNYTAKVVDREKIANHPTWVVELRPRDPSERWKRLWIDQKTWVVLQSEDLQKQRPFRRTTFTAVEYLEPTTPVGTDEFQPPQDLVQRYGRALPGDTSDRFQDLEALGRLVGFKIHAPKRLPKGYVLEGAYQIPCICGLKHQAVRLEYSDGLNRLSLFEAGHPECKAPSGTHKSGGLAANHTENGVYYWAFGDLPNDELNRILKSAAGSE